jgi:Uma2 family endonuclease
LIPDLCVEVTSPNDLYDDVMGKMQEYFEYGVREVWVVWPPRRQVSVYRSPDDVTILKAGDQLTGGDLLPGFTTSVASLFHRTAATP